MVGAAFLLYVVITILGVLNVIAAVFVEVAVNKAKGDYDLSLQEDRHNQQQLAKEQRVATSLQFELTAFSDTQMERYVSLCADHGVPLAWFGRKVPVGFTSSINQW